MTVLENTKFRYCPRCGENNLHINDDKSLICQSCNFTYYHNPAAVVIAILEHEDKIVLTKRAFEPQQGKLALPGGFVDYEESLEAALAREMREELNLTIRAPNTCAHPGKHTNIGMSSIIHPLSIL